MPAEIRPGHRERQDDLGEYLPARRAVDQRAFLQLVGDGAEIAHQQPGAERDQEGRVGEDQRPARVEEAQLRHDGGERDEQDRRRHQVGEEDREADLLRALVAQALDGVGGQHRRDQRDEGRHHGDHHRVPHPFRVGGLEQQLLDVGERRMDHPERIGVAREQLLVRLERGGRHPVEREQQHEREHRQRQVHHHGAPRQLVQVAHALGIGFVVVGRGLCSFVLGPLLPGPALQAEIGKHDRRQQERHHGDGDGGALAERAAGDARAGTTASPSGAWRSAGRRA